MKKLQIGILVLAIILLIPQRICAEHLTEQWKEALPNPVAELMEEEEQPVYHTWNQGLQLLWNAACSQIEQIIKESLRGLVWILAAILLCSIAEDCLQLAGNPPINLVSVTGALVITLAAAGNIKTLVGLGWDTIEKLNVFSKALLPTLGAAVAASGGMASAGVKQVAAVFFSDLTITVIQTFLLPMIYCYIAVSAAAAMISQPNLGRIGEGIRKGIVLLLTGVLLLFTAYLGISGVLSGSADHLALQITKTAIGTALPVVGSILSGASESLLAGASVVKNTIGVAGLLGIMAIVLLPVLKLGIQYLLYKLASFLAETVSSPALAGLIQALGSAFGLVLGMTGTCALLLMISVASSISVVTT
ncbi:MAG: stage III sporulation protein AE [Ruminococcaceae bacterium]|nr:stage III sporulation protein AE [Oscillospiraceae bacterium]